MSKGLTLAMLMDAKNQMDQAVAKQSCCERWMGQLKVFFFFTGQNRVEMICPKCGHNLIVRRIR